MLLLFASLIDTAYTLGYYSTETTPWAFKLFTEEPENDWFARKFFEPYILGEPDKTGAMAVLKAGNDSVRTLYPICDDLWADLEASEFCRMNGYKQGRRTSTTTKLDYIESQLNCYDFNSYGSNVLSAYEECGVIKYEPGMGLTCSRDQAAAVYCWNEPWIPDFAVVTKVMKLTKKKFKVKVVVGTKKYGKFYNSIGDDTLGKRVTSKDFEMFCGSQQYPVKLKVKIQQKNEEVVLSGRFLYETDCPAGSCFQIFYRDTSIADCFNHRDYKQKFG